MNLNSVGADTSKFPFVVSLSTHAALNCKSAAVLLFVRSTWFDKLTMNGPIINGTGLLELSLPCRGRAEGARWLCCVVLIDMD